MSSNNRVTLRVWGDFACFTRPEMKVERVSYPVMTPSAGRGILEAVYWEPQMFYLIDAIRVVKRGRWISFRRNEVIKVISIDNAQTWMRAPEKTAPIQAGGGAEDATQRNMLALQDVEYLITAEIRATLLGDRPEDANAKHIGQIERRAKQGKCFHRPALGVREFAADFEWVEGDPEAALARRAAALGRTPGQYNEDLGLMLYDVFDPKERAHGFRWLREDELAATASAAKPHSRGRNAASEQVRWKGELIKPQAAFFHAEVKQSKLDCHPDRVKILTPTAVGGN